MALQQGVRLGTFEVLGPLGAGGMGEVYRARDTRLGRDVAIKVLPEAFARDPARAARFEREARLLAAINHPTIAAIYGAEEFDSLRCIILELVEGETLAERLTRGALSIDESRGLASQIAEALEAAHERGVVHRDLKPSNIKITPEGKVKVLDFGLAKAMELPSDADMSQSPTAVGMDTRPGMIVGTVEFMSPEQARGKPVDKRTDIWAFGCILFEMLSGRRAFTGETPSDVLAAILAAEPDWKLLPSATPPRLRELLGRCLEKDANRRLRDIGEARIATQQRAVGAAPFRSSAASRMARPRNLMIVLALAALLAAVWVALRPREPGRATLPGNLSLAVLPFRDLSPESHSQLLGDGLAETVSVRLARLPGVQVVNPAAVTDAYQKETDPYRAAAKLGATMIVSGSFQRSREQMRISFAILNAGRKSQLALDEVRGAASELFAMEDQVADKIAGHLNRPRPSAHPSAPSGLETAGQQERYLVALGDLQRYDKPASVDAAIQSLEGLAAERPNNALVDAALGRAYLYRYNLTRDKSWAEKAAAAVARARASAPDLPEVDATLGELLLRTGKAREAVAAFQKALALQPNNFDALLGLARAHDAAGDSASAEAAYKRAIELQPGYFAAYSKLAGFYFNHGQFESASRAFERVTQLTPDNARAFANLGAAYHRMNRYEDALAAYRKAIAIEPTSLAYSNAGATEFFLGHFAEASGDFEKAVALTPGRYDGWADLGDAYFWSGQQEKKAADAYARAIRLARSELEVNPRNAAAHGRMAICLARTRQPAAAAAEVSRAVALAPHDPSVLYDAAIVASASGRDAEALDWIGRAVSAGFGVLQIQSEPEFARLKKNPRFERELRQNTASKP